MPLKDKNLPDKYSFSGQKNRTISKTVKVPNTYNNNKKNEKVQRKNNEIKKPPMYL